MPNRQHIAFCQIRDFPRLPVRTNQLQSAFLLAFLKECAPFLGDDRFEALFREIVQLTADDLVSRDTQQLAGANAGLAGQTVVVGQQNRCRRLEYDGAEQCLQLVRTVSKKPVV